MLNDNTLRLMQWAGRGYCCSQILIGMALEDAGTESTALLRAAQGICVGGGTCDGACGILTGGKLLLALYAGKGNDNEEAHTTLPLLLDEYHQWFSELARSAYGGISCGDILQQSENECVDAQPDPEKCGSMLAKAYEKIGTLLLEQGLDPATIEGVSS